MRSIVCLIAAVAIGLASTTDAAAEPIRITLAEALEQALARNRDLTVARREVDVGQGRLRQARRYPFNPLLVIEGEAGRAVGREESDRRGVGGGKIGLEQVIEVQGQRGHRVRGAEADLARTEWQARNAEREVIADTTRAFAELLVAQERALLAQDGLRLATRLRDVAKELVGAGDVPELDQLRAEVEVRRAANRVTREDALRQTTVRELALLTGTPAAAELTAAGPLLLDPLPGDLDSLIAQARAQRPDLKAAEAAVESARAAAALVRAERFLPSLTLSASYGEGLEFDSRSRLALFGVSIPLPLWNRRDGDVTAAEAEAAKQEAERDRLLARIDKEVVAAFHQFGAARQVVQDYLERIVPAQEENTRLVEHGYRLGQLRLGEALLAQRDLADARAAYLEAVAAYNAARAELGKATGQRR